MIYGKNINSFKLKNTYKYPLGQRRDHKGIGKYFELNKNKIT